MVIEVSESSTRISKFYAIYTMILNAINANTTKWTNTLKKFAGNSRQIV